jgi:hypothetical protein
MHAFRAFVLKRLIIFWLTIVLLAALVHDPFANKKVIEAIGPIRIQASIAVGTISLSTGCSDMVPKHPRGPQTRVWTACNSRVFAI